MRDASRTAPDTKPRPTRGEPGPRPLHQVRMPTFEGRNVRRRAGPDSRAGGPIGRRAPRAACTRTRKGRRQTRIGSSAAFLLRRAPRSPANERGGPLGSPSPRCLFRASPPLARATRPGGRRRPSLPQGRPCSTLGAGRLNFRVRYGSGCAPAAVAAGPRGALRRGLLWGGEALRAPWGPHSARGSDCLENGRERRDLEWSRRARPISGARLKASPPLHLRPINQVVSLGPYRREGPSRGRLPA